jgi:hypothetical protein
MIKDEPIIFTVRNFDNYAWKFRIPYDKDFNTLKPDGRIHVFVDIKVNMVWYKNVLPDDIGFDFMPGQSLTILVKPHNDEYFAGWGRWFRWEDCMTKKNIVGRSYNLVAVLSDPDYAHLESETEIGDEFRARQYSDCINLIVAPNENLDEEFEEIGENFRYGQYSNCVSLAKKPIEVFPKSVKKIGRWFRKDQYERTKFVPEYILPHQKNDENFLNILARNNFSLVDQYLDILVKHLEDGTDEI